MKGSGIYEIDKETKRKRVKGQTAKGQTWIYKVYAFVPKSIKPSGMITRTFPKDTPRGVMEDWQQDTERKAKEQLKGLIEAATVSSEQEPGTFEQDAASYLQQVGELVSLRERKRQLAIWVELFQGRNRRTIQPSEIRVHLSNFRKRFSISTCKALKSTLSNFFDVLENHIEDRNPVLKVKTKWGTDEIAPRFVEFAEAERAIDSMPRNLTHYRLKILLHTGMRPSQLGRVIPEKHLDLDAATLTVPKGKGRKKGGNMIPLGAAAVEAFKGLIRCADPKRGNHKRVVWGRAFHCGKATKALKAACKRVKVKPISVYCLRHTRAQDLLEQGASDGSAAHMLNHTDKRMLEKYQRANVKHLRKFVA